VESLILLIGVSVLLVILVSILRLEGLMMKITSLFVVGLFVLASCGDSYRYPCQDPAKAYTVECSCTARTKNKAISAFNPDVTTDFPSTTHGIRGINC
jgi:hypothetical protein